MSGAVFDDDTIGRLKALPLRLKRLHAGDLGRGAAAAHSAGRAEFKDHVAYASGDDLRTLDWNLYARLGQLFVRRFAGEVDRDVHILLDRSGSMAGGSPSKDVFGRRLAAAYTLAALAGGRRVRLLALSAAVRPIGAVFEGRPSFNQAIAALEGLAAVEGRLAPETVLGAIRGGGDRRFVLLVSDLLDDAAPLERALAARGRGVEVAVLAVSTAEERDPPAAEVLEIVGAEGEGSVVATGGAARRERYRERYAEHFAAIEHLVRSRGGSFERAAVETAFDEVFVDLLGKGMAP